VLRIALEVLRLGIGFVLLCRLPRPERAQDGALDLAVIVPARNEAEMLPGLLASLAAQTEAAEEVVVVDDDSTDATARVVEQAGVRLLTAPPRPEGWNGKQWACHVGLEATTAARVCFLDADVELAPDALARVAATVAACGGLVSVQPWHRTGSPVEGLSLFPNLISMMAVDAFGPLGGRIAPTGAFGPVLAATRADHLRAGGHEAVRSVAMEDVALAGSYPRAGLPVTVLAGRDVATFRMYRGGLPSIFEGWVKGLGSGARRVRPLTLLAVGAWISGMVSVPLNLLTRPLLGAALWVAYAAQLAWLGRRIGRFPVWTFALFPLALAFFLVVFTRSMAAALLHREVTWKGRRLKV